jgi:hypothetical protein
MASRPLTLLILLYVALDFANPLMPGAVSFAPAASVDGVPIQDRIPSLPSATARTRVPPSTETREETGLTARQPPPPASGELLVDVTLARSNLFDPPPATDDQLSR